MRGLSVTSYPDLAFRIGAALLQHDSVARVIVATIDSQGVHEAYDARITVAGCGDPVPEIPTVDRLRIAKRLLLRVEVRRRELGCTSVGTTDFRTVHLLDAAHAFRRVLSYQADSLEYGNAEDGAVRPVVFRHLYDYPDVCLEDGCQVLSAIVVNSERRGWQGIVRWHWNADSTALVPDAK